MTMVLYTCAVVNYNRYMDTVTERASLGSGRWNVTLEPPSHCESCGGVFTLVNCPVAMLPLGLWYCLVCATEWKRTEMAVGVVDAGLPVTPDTHRA